MPARVTAWTPTLELIVDRDAAAIARPRVAAAPTLIAPLASTTIALAVGARRERLDRTTFALVPAVEARYGCGGVGRRGVFGKSSGGYGALVHAMRRADVWAAAACHSGDVGFEWCYLPDLPPALRVLEPLGGSVAALLAAIEATDKPGEERLEALMMCAMAASYDPDPTAPFGVRLPVDPLTCELDPERWQRWLAWDPLRMVDACAANLRTLRGLYIDCGRRDQYNLVYGARQLHRALDRLAVPHRYDEFDDDHTAIDYRMDDSLPFLARALA